MAKPQKPKHGARAPRIRVPNSERALFTIDGANFVGVLQRLSLSGGSAVLAKGPIAYGTMGYIALNSVYGKVTAHVEFLHTGADGVPLAQAFRFLTMDDASSERFAKAAEEMIREGFSDAPAEPKSPASEVMGRLLGSVRALAATIVTKGS